MTGEYNNSENLLSPEQGAAGSPAPRKLLIGIGNPDREDDGVAWVLMDHLAARLDPGGTGLRDESERVFEDGRLHLLFDLQIMPEMAELIAGFDQVCFVDAHTGSQPEDLYCLELQPQFQTSPLTHHMTPETCLFLVDSLFGRQPQAWLMAVRGFSFNFTRSLSPRTEALARQAEEMLWDWLHDRPVKAR
ncbi:MAG TPA: hypothetical protein GYA06_03125 [Chloroflexi bacterium]|jgi:hydrogenase maturation protease|nr:hypothetical protein [Chloroflexota bacterium]